VESLLGHCRRDIRLCLGVHGLFEIVRRHGAGSGEDASAARLIESALCGQLRLFEGERVVGAVERGEELAGGHLVAFIDGDDGELSRHLERDVADRARFDGAARSDHQAPHDRCGGPNHDGDAWRRVSVTLRCRGVAEAGREQEQGERRERREEWTPVTM